MTEDKRAAIVRRAATIALPVVDNVLLPIEGRVTAPALRARKAIGAGVMTGARDRETGASPRPSRHHCLSLTSPSSRTIMESILSLAKSR